MAALIQKFFKPKWQHAKAEVRLQALDSLDDQAVLLSLAQTDAEHSVRIKAIQRLKQPADLVSFFNVSQADIQSQALSQFLMLVLGSDQKDAQLNKVQTLQDSETLMQIATYADDETLRQMALKQIASEQALFDFILSSPSPKARHLASERIEDAALLNTIARQFKGKDKTLVKLARQKLDVIEAAAAKEAERQANIQRLIDQAVQLSKSSFNPNYGGQLLHLKQQWETQPSPSSEQNLNFEAAIKVCDETLEVNKAEADRLAQAAADKASAEVEQRAVLLELHAAIDQIRQQGKADPSALNALVKTQQQRWSQATQLNKPSKADQKEYDDELKKLVQMEQTAHLIVNKQENIDQLKGFCQNLSQTNHSDLLKLKKSAEQIQRAISWPSDIVKPNIVNDLVQWIGLIDAALDNNKQNEKDKIKKIESNLKIFEESIAAGHIKEAKKLQQQLQSYLAAIPSGKAKSFQGQMHLLAGQLKELMDWKGFATTPKMETLCEKMEALIHSDLPADRVAEAIHALQDEWKSLGSGDPKVSQELWVRFKAASDTAYEPCREHFNQLGAIRAANKEKRLSLCQQLDDFYTQNDWLNADWKAIQVLMDAAKEEWRAYSPVDRKDHKPLQEQFNHVLGQIRAKLTEEYERNSAEKQALVDQAEALLSAEDLNEAIETSKKLQNQWKTLGQAGRKDFQLWKSFRQHCDALFARRESEKVQRKSEIEQTIQQAEALVSEASALLNTETPEAQRPILLELQNRYRELQVPKRVHEKITRELERISLAIESEIESKKRAASHQQWVDARILSTQIAAQEASGEMDAESLKASLSELKIPAQAKALFENRIQHASEASTSEQLKRLCLELEISMGLDSPEADKADRMALQVALLQERMGQGTPPRHQQLQQLQLSWFAMTGGDAAYEPLSERFFSAVDRCL